MKILITGGAGFIGRHLADELMKKNDVAIFDNFFSGKMEFLRAVNEVIRGDIRDLEEIKKACKEVDVVYHFAADPDVRRSTSGPLENFRIDTLGTLNVLEACRLNNIKHIVFASSSVVYGNAKIPTPEGAPLAPVSNYAAAKVSSEYYIKSYSQLYSIKATILRYANIIGPRLTHGVIYDFYNKLKENPKGLEILGNGNQKKSYIHVKDAVDATLLTAQKTRKCDVFNVGSEEMITVRRISRLVTSMLGLKNVRYNYTGGKTGWLGDVPIMLLSIEKLRSLCWKPKYTIEESIFDTISWLKNHL